jgi:hypothetical protein
MKQQRWKGIGTALLIFLAVGGVIMFFEGSHNPYVLAKYLGALLVLGIVLRLSRSFWNWVGRH